MSKLDKPFKVLLKFVIMNDVCVSLPACKGMEGGQTLFLYKGLLLSDPAPNILNKQLQPLQPFTPTRPSLYTNLRPESPVYRPQTRPSPFTDPRPDPKLSLYSPQPWRLATHFSRMLSTSPPKRGGKHRNVERRVYGTPRRFADSSKSPGDFYFPGASWTNLGELSCM